MAASRSAFIGSKDPLRCALRLREIHGHDFLVVRRQAQDRSVRILRRRCVMRTHKGERQAERVLD
jgi:hypothetical protein